MRKPVLKRSHITTRLTCHIVWVTKYRYHELKGGISKRCCERVIHVCDLKEVEILIGVVSRKHVHIHIEYPPRTSISELVKRMKGGTSKMFQKQFLKLKKSYWGIDVWTAEYRAWSRNITVEMDQVNLEHH